MKILKIRIKRKQSDHGTHYSYPKEYEPSKIKVLCYETTNMDNYNEIINRGNDHEFLVGLVRDEDADKFLESKYVEELTYKQALSYGKKCIKEEIKIIDESKVLSVLDKVLNDKKLTIREKNSINPNKSAKGVNLINSFKSILDYHYKK